MKRFAWILGLIIGLASQASAYDGPSPAAPQYDQTLNGIHVTFTTQTKVLNGGKAHFTATIEVPISADNVGKNVVFEVWKFTGAPSDLLIDNSCARAAVAGDVGTVVTFSCELFAAIPGTLIPGNNVIVYPKVIRNSTGAPTEHNGVGSQVTIPIVGDDVYESNNSIVNPRTLTISGNAFAATYLVQGLNNDFYRFTAPMSGSADVTIEFWNDANDIDLTVYDSTGNEIATSPSSNNIERIIFAVVSGAQYIFAVYPSAETVPVFYDLSIAFGASHTLTAAPAGTPNPVPGGGLVQLNANASDSLGHALGYTWSQQCFGIGLGTFSNRYIAAPTWTSPVNSTGSQKSCTMKVDVTDGVITIQRTFSQAIDQAVHTLSITTAPSGSPNPVPSGATASLQVVATDTFNHTVSYAWTASCPTLASSGTFVPGANVQNPSWNAPANQTSGSVGCTLSVTASDGQGMTANADYSQTVLPESALSYSYYFAEGATIGGFFATRFALLNTDASHPANVALDFQLKDTTSVLTHSINIAAHSRATVDVGTLGSINPGLSAMASAEFSTVIRSDRPLIADRTMTWNNSGYGSHAETSIPAPASEWYLAEGATIGNFELYYLIQNPNNTPLDSEIEVTYLLPPPAAPIVRYYSMGANTRTNIAVHAEPGLENVEVSAIIRTPGGKPVIVERAMYMSAQGLLYAAGHESAGIRSPEQGWFFAEGATGNFFDLFILIGNPNATEAHITATFLFDDGTMCSMPGTVGAKSRYNIWVDVTEILGCPRSLADAAVSTTITSDIPVVAERTMWWPGPSAGNWTEAHNAAGATETGTKWGLADGEQGGARSNETYILIANTSSYAGTARVTLYFEDGATVSKDVPLNPNSRTNVAVGAPVPSGGFGDDVTNKKFGAVIESLPVSGQSGPAEIVVERAMYSNGPGAPFWSAGTDVLATKLQ
jgi:hypothetical protein